MYPYMYTHTHEMRIFFSKSDGGDTIGEAPDRGDFLRLARSSSGGRSLSCCHSVQEVESVPRKMAELQVLWFSSNFPIKTTSSWRTPAYAALDSEPFSANQGSDSHFVMRPQKSPMTRITPVALGREPRFCLESRVVILWKTVFRRILL